MNIDGLAASALSVRALSMDAVEEAKSGHPGLPMGCAELGSLIYGELMKHNPDDPEWIDRDRFILSAGHGSLLLYSLLHLSGYDISLEDIKKFRQLGSKTPGHPEYKYTPGVETTTGPLGAGFSNAVGFAIAETMLAETFNTPKHSVIDHYTYSLAGDGCLMEGISSEAASLAGHLGLGKLIVFYDSNKISIEGNTSLAFTEDVAARFRGYNWQVLEGDAYDFEEMSKLALQAKEEKNKPSLIILSSIIGKGSPNKAGTHGIHGAPLGAEELKAAHEALGIPAEEMFFVHPAARSYFEEKHSLQRKRYEEWKRTFDAWSSENPELKKKWDTYFSDRGGLPAGIEWPEFQIGEGEATRKVSGAVLQKLAPFMPNLVGGSADLAPSNNTELKGLGHYSKTEHGGRNLHFGVREHAMGGIANGIALHGGLRVFSATFLVFSDYMRPTLRLAAMMKLPVVFIYTHDSVFIGKDGPTHQPIEHVASIRTIPGMTVLRPGDPQETVEAWKMAIENQSGPTALILSRQKLTTYEKADPNWPAAMRSGAYVVKDTEGTPDTVVLATGSEVGIALKAVELSSKKTRIISVADLHTFNEMDRKAREKLIPPSSRVIVAEPGSSSGWGVSASDRRDLSTPTRLAESGPGDEVAAHLGFTPEKLAALIDEKK